MTPDQMRLLRGVLLVGDDAGHNMTSWCETTDLDSVDGSSHRLLPLLFRGLSQRELAPPELDRLRGVYRKSWYRNQQHVAAVATAIRVLDGAGIGHAVVAGLPLALTAYDDLGARMIPAVRVVVLPVDGESTVDLLSRAVGLLSRRGFVTVDPSRGYGWGLPTLLATPGGGVLDVRGSVYGPGWSEAPDHELSARLVPLEGNGFATSTLDATDAMVEAATHAAATQDSWLQGLADIAFVARRADPAVDWAQVSARYDRTPLAVPLHEAVGTLIDEIGASLGTGAAKWHGEYKARAADRIGAWTHRNGRRLLRLPAWYRRGVHAQGRVMSPSGFITFAAAVYGIESPADAVRRVKRRVRMVVGERE